MDNRLDAASLDVDRLVQYLDNLEEASPYFREMGLENLVPAHANLVSMTKLGLTLDLVGIICRQLSEHLPTLSDPDMALNNLERFFTTTRNPLSLGTLFERDPEALPTLLQILSTSQHLSDLLIRDPESYDLLRITEGQPVVRDVLVKEICSEVDVAGNERAVMTVLRRYKHRESLRIAYGDIVCRHRLATVTEQISFLADAICEAALRFARRRLEEARGVPRRADGERARFVVLALGKLGGVELNYSSDIDVVFLSDGNGTTDGGKTDGKRPISNQEFFDRLVRDFVKLLTENTELGTTYRVDLRLRPDGRQGPSVMPLENALQYYDISGRTWERQAFVKARPMAGDIDLGEEFLSDLEPWIYRRYLNRADITGIKALKRRIEQRAHREGGDATNVKTGHGGIRDIEFVIQFLQLLNGGDLPEIRTGNTLKAIDRLEEVGCLSLQERTFLEENYEFLRKIEHRLQIMFDLQTHTLPSDDDEMRRLAIRMGYRGPTHSATLEQFQTDYRSKTDLNRKILDRVLHDAFGGDEPVAPETDLVLDPDPPKEWINECLGGYGFGDPQAAYRNLVTLSVEKVPFLSTRRCRHFLASIAPALLQAIADTPDPDTTLVMLSKVSDSLGGKGVLWELFSFNPPSVRLYVRLCATSPYLAGILTSNPGMIDELLDSLLLDKLPSFATLERTIADLCRGAEDVAPILYSFKNAGHLRVGVRDIMGKEDVSATHRALSDIAEVCLNQIAARESERLVKRYGAPTNGEGPREGEECEFVILALGKLGGREPNYHSDLDVVFLYEADGHTRHRHRGRQDDCTTNQHFFSQLAQRIIKSITHLGPHGRLYELDPRLRPTGRSGSLAVSLRELTRYFEEGQGQLWERQALCKSRVVFGSPEARQRTMDAVRHAIVARPWQPENAEEIRKMRLRLQQTATPLNLKRGEGGTVDIEFTVQMLQLQHSANHPEVLVPGTLDAIDALCAAGCLSKDDASYLQESYRFLRSVEARLRLMNTTARHDLPEDEMELKRLSYLLNHDGPDALRQDCLRHRRENRRRFHLLFDQAVHAATS